MQATHAQSAAALILMALAGCDSFPKNAGATAAALAEAVGPAFSLSVLATNGQVSYAASVDATSISLQDLLRSLGLPVNVSQDPSGTVRIASALPDGTRFRLLVQQAPAPAGGTTTASSARVAFEWDNPSDSSKVQVFAQLESQKHRDGK